MLKPVNFRKKAAKIYKWSNLQLKGTGKTAAFLLPLIDMIHNSKRRPDGLFHINSDSPYAIM